jgi:hypothetical protein
LRVFADDIETIQTGAQRNGLLVDGRQVHRRLKKRIGEIAGDDVFESLNDAAAESGDAAVEIEDCGLDAVFALEAEVAIGDLECDGDENGRG